MRSEILSPQENMDIQITEDVQYVLVFEDFSPEKKYELNFVMEKPGVTAEVMGLYKIGDGQQMNLTTVSNHQAPHTTFRTNVKGILMEGAYSDYVGKIIIAEPAQQTNSYLADDVLVVGEGIKNKSQPILEIEADDVKASHGATTGRVSEEQLYYLQSRGMSRSEAENLIIEGFLESLLAQIVDETIREQVREKVYA